MLFVGVLSVVVLSVGLLYLRLVRLMSPMVLTVGLLSVMVMSVGLLFIRLLLTRLL